LNGNDPELLREQPCECHLRWRCLFLRSDPGQQVDHGLIGFDGLDLEPLERCLGDLFEELSKMIERFCLV